LLRVVARVLLSQDSKWQAEDGIPKELVVAICFLRKGALFEERFKASKYEGGLQEQSCSVLPSLKGKLTFVHIPENTQLAVYSAFTFKKQQNQIQLQFGRI